MAADDQSLAFYDMTRLVAVRLSPIATGIDRIDQRFARAVFEAYGERCFPVVRVGSKALLADRGLSRALILGLERTWFEGRPRDLRIARALEVAGLTQRIDGPLTQGLHNRKGRCGGPAALRLSYLALTALNGLCRAGLFVGTRARNALRQNARTTIPSLLSDGASGLYVVCSHGGIARCDGLLPHLTKVCRLKAVAYIHDILPIDYPEYFPPGKPKGFARFLSELVRAGAAFVVNSRDTARRLEGHARRMKWSIGEVSVVHPGIETRPAVARNGAGASPGPNGGAPYFVVVGTIEPRKNHLLLLQVWRDLVRAGTRPMPHLHIVGMRGWENENVLDLLDRCEAIRPYVIEHGELADPELRRLIIGARAVLFPSFAEGFGLPLLEALHLGARVIASDLPVFREIAGNAPRYVSPLDGLGWRRAIVECLGQTQPPATEGPRILANGFDWETRSREFLDKLRAQANGSLRHAPEMPSKKRASSEARQGAELQ